MAAGMAHFGMQPDDLGALPKGDERKLALATLINQRATVTTRWLADTLFLGHPSRVSQGLRGGSGINALKKLENALFQ